MRQLGGILRRFSCGSLYLSVLLFVSAGSQTLVAADGDIPLISRLSKGLAAGIPGKLPFAKESPAKQSPFTQPSGSSGRLNAASPESKNSSSKFFKVLKKGSSGRSARQAGLKSLPLEKMTQENRKKAEEHLDRVSLFRELPTLQFHVEPEVYRFFTLHPEVAVSVWRAMEISKFQMRLSGANKYVAENDDGTSGEIQVLFRGRNQHVILCRGFYKSPLISKSIQADAMIHLQTEFLKDDKGRPLARHRVHMFVSFPSQAVQAAAKLVSPVSNLIIDRNFQEISMFLQLMSTAMARQPGWVEHIAAKLEGVEKKRKTELIDLTADVYIATRKREKKNLYRNSRITIEEVSEPLRLKNPRTSGSTIFEKNQSGTSKRLFDSKESDFPIVPAGGFQRVTDSLHFSQDDEPRRH